MAGEGNKPELSSPAAVEVVVDLLCEGTGDAGDGFEVGEGGAAYGLGGAEALEQGGHSSASQLIASGTWTIDGSNLRIEVPGMGKKMLALTVNATAEKILRQTLQKLGGPARFMVVPGAGTGTLAPVPASAPKGSVQQIALDHPLVKRAQEIFNAEVRSVVDLRTK